MINPNGWFTTLVTQQFKYCPPLDRSIKCDVLTSFAAVIAVLAVGGSALAASVVNKDSEIRTLIVTEGGSKTKLALHPGETVEFCPNGCFVTWPNGDLEPLTGSETIEISGGVARIK